MPSVNHCLIHLTFRVIEDENIYLTSQNFANNHAGV